MTLPALCTCEDEAGLLLALTQRRMTMKMMVMMMMSFMKKPRKKCLVLNKVTTRLSCWFWMCQDLYICHNHTCHLREQKIAPNFFKLWNRNISGTKTYHEIALNIFNFSQPSWKLHLLVLCFPSKTACLNPQQKFNKILPRWFFYNGRFNRATTLRLVLLMVQKSGKLTSWVW